MLETLMAIYVALGVPVLGFAWELGRRHAVAPAPPMALPAARDSGRRKPQHLIRIEEKEAEIERLREELAAAKAELNVWDERSKPDPHHQVLASRFSEPVTLYGNINVRASVLVTACVWTPFGDAIVYEFDAKRWVAIPRSVEPAIHERIVNSVFPNALCGHSQLDALLR